MLCIQKPSLGMLRVFGCDAYAYDHTHYKQIFPYAKNLKHGGIPPDSKGWLLWCEETGKVLMAVLDREAIVLAIVCDNLGNFGLGNALDEQDVAVVVLESRDPYESYSPTYDQAIKSVEVREWESAMVEEIDSLEHHQVHTLTIAAKNHALFHFKTAFLHS
ncbi:uncharacterized protein VP01_2620g1 [Puccinia sorghi]|uniref:Uncharacterized protein n=1 Tax=Puccinia sorghi TaxID=27349 RepID=A0A0L6V4E5_9BASI|nr:uncharacterized protein VP01_2620g1 [Puccinia sorghi]